MSASRCGTCRRVIPGSITPQADHGHIYATLTPVLACWADSGGAGEGNRLFLGPEDTEPSPFRSAFRMGIRRRKLGQRLGRLKAGACCGFGSTS